MKFLIGKDREFLIKKSSNQTISTDKGMIDTKKLRIGKVVKTHLGEEFLVAKPNFYDLFSRIKRGPQIIRLKDGAYIAFRLGIKEGDKVLDCGGGSGAMTLILANIVGQKGKVISVEKNKKFCEIIKENSKFMGFNNIEVINSDLDDIDIEQFDAINIDLPAPWNHLEKIDKLLKPGAMVSFYTPNTTQAQRLRNEIKGFRFEGMYEIVEREWKVGGEICHPKFHILGHTGFISFYRKLG